MLSLTPTRDYDNGVAARMGLSAADLPVGFRGCDEVARSQ
jgi:hypothetical protein